MDDKVEMDQRACQAMICGCAPRNNGVQDCPIRGRIAASRRARARERADPRLTWSFDEAGSIAG